MKYLKRYYLSSDQIRHIKESHVYKLIFYLFHLTLHILIGLFNSSTKKYIYLFVTKQD